MPAELAHYTITGAQDWPMFKEMLAGMRILFFLLWGTIATGGGFMWRDLRNRIASQRSEDRENCLYCKKERDANFLEVWDAMDQIAPRDPRVAAAKKKFIDAGA